MFDVKWSEELLDRGGRAPRIVLYSHDTLGFGHFRRSLLLAGALKRCVPTPEILMIGGMREAGAFELPEGVDCVTLPAYAKQGDGGYRPRDLGRDLSMLTHLRARTIKAAVEAFEPDLMIVDNVPRGAQYELDPTLKALSAHGRTRLVLGLRDVIDRPSVVRRQWLRQRSFEAVNRHYDAVWIYGDPDLYDITEDCGFAGAFGGKARHVGYLDHSVRHETPLAATEAQAILGDDPSPYVVCAVGGGRDGADLCEAFARAEMPEGHRGILITGSQMPGPMREHIQDLVAHRDDMTLRTFVREPIALMAGAARIVAMGGYNTTCEILAFRRPALIVPRARPREEQLIRARRLAARGLADMLHPDDLTPGTLGAWLAGPAPDPDASSGHVDMGGLDRVRQLAEDMLLTAAPSVRAS